MLKNIKNFSGIFENAQNLIKEIRKYSESQKDLWRRVPLLALEADGRTTYSTKYNRAYTMGFWPLESSLEEEVYTVIVNLENGKLIKPNYIFPNIFIQDKIKEIPADDKNILNLALCLDEINAKKIIENLKKEAKKPYNKIYTSLQQENWRAKLKLELGLSEFYTRK